jgi:hypothetical protein
MAIMAHRDRAKCYYNNPHQAICNVQYAILYFEQRYKSSQNELLATFFKDGLSLAIGIAP